MAEKNVRKTIVIGHRNPDTDSVCSAIAYADLKGKLTGNEFMPGRAGHVNEETQFVLNYFGVKRPTLIENVKMQVKDIEMREVPSVDKNLTLKKAWNLMQEVGATTLPVLSDRSLVGLVTVGDITKSYMNVYDSRIVATAKTQYSNILDTIEGALVVGAPESYFDKGKVLIAAANPDMMEYYIEENDLVILGNRYESQLCAIEMRAGCIIVCEGASVSMTIRKLAQEKGCVVITTPYDAYTVARLMNQSIPISHFMTTEGLITFDMEDYIDEIREVMASKRHRDFPVLDKEGRYKGMISRRDLLGAKGKKVILVDHNERTQAVSGIESCEIVEIIDHHRLGTIETMSPVFFRNQPLGCTATIIYQIHKENHVTIEKHIAGLLCSAIISDTLLFRSPTCTEVDKAAALELAGIAEINIEEYAKEMFSAGSNLKNKTEKEIFYQDFKRFNVGKTSIGVGQINSLDAEELGKIKDQMIPYLKTAREEQGLDMVFFMLTSILDESTDLLFEGNGAEQLAEVAFRSGISGQSTYLPGIVSRKKQLIPSLMTAMQQ